jgi:hypothetical protein
MISKESSDNIMVFTWTNIQIIRGVSVWIRTGILFSVGQWSYVVPEPALHFVDVNGLSLWHNSRQ